MALLFFIFKYIYYNKLWINAYSMRNCSQKTIDIISSIAPSSVELITN